MDEFVHGCHPYPYTSILTTKLRLGTTAARSFGFV